MSFNIYEDPNLNMNVRYCKGARDDGGDKVERLVDIYESVDADHPVCTRDEGAHTQKHLAAVQRNPLRTAALVLGLLCLLLVAVVIVLTTLYISITLEKDHLQSTNQELQSNYEELQSNYEELQSSYNNLSYSFCQTQGNITEWERFRCSCYYKSTERKNWTESRRDCQERGADLVIINNKEEHEFVRKHGDSWIGLQSVKKSGWEEAWEWVDGSVTHYWPWHKGVIVNPKDRVGLTAYIDLEGSWKHTKIGSKRWICERQIY